MPSIRLPTSPTESRSPAPSRRPNFILIWHCLQQICIIAHIFLFVSAICLIYATMGIFDDFHATGRFISGTFVLGGFGVFLNLTFYISQSALYNMSGDGNIETRFKSQRLALLFGTVLRSVFGVGESALAVNMYSHSAKVRNEFPALSEQYYLTSLLVWFTAIVIFLTITADIAKMVFIDRPAKKSVEQLLDEQYNDPYTDDETVVGDAPFRHRLDDLEEGEHLSRAQTLSPSSTELMD